MDSMDEDKKCPKHWGQKFSDSDWYKTILRTRSNLGNKAWIPEIPLTKLEPEYPYFPSRLPRSVATEDCGFQGSGLPWNTRVKPLSGE